MKTVLVVGGGGREHAIVDALSRSPQVGKIYCAPGNAGIASQAECVPIKDTDVEALKAFAQEKNLPCYLSLEERMACGIGACLGCVCRASSPAPHFGTETRRVCADGPVFEAGEVIL